MRTATIEAKGNFLSMQGPKQKERLGIRNGLSMDVFGRRLFEGFGVMQLVAPYLPKHIHTNFRVQGQIQEMIGKMYQSEKRKPPIFHENLAPKAVRRENLTEAHTKRRAVVAYSAGKDSMWNLWWAQEKYGEENVLCVHIYGLNRNNATQEREYCQRQAKELKLPHFKVIDLLNSSQNTGFKIMRSRDMFIMALVAPLAIEFGASEIITEGFAESGPNEPFTGQETGMLQFNDFLKKTKVPLKVSWRNRKEMLVVKDLLVHRPDWLPHVCNCFACLHHKPNCRRAWKKRMPSFKLYDSQCGSCVKCRVITLARILYEPGLGIKPKEAEAFVRDTYRWMKTKRTTFDMITSSFERDLKQVQKKFGFSV